MATRSTISIVDKKAKNGQGRQIYCHWDGYPENNGKILLEHYQDANKINELIDLGNISSLAENIHPKTTGTKREYKDGVGYVSVETEIPHSLDNKHEGVVAAYFRDRGDDGQEAKKFIGARPSREFSEEFDYLFVVEESQWYVRDNDGNKPRFSKLTKKMCGIS